MMACRDGGGGGSSTDCRGEANSWDDGDGGSSDGGGSRGSHDGDNRDKTLITISDHWSPC